MCPSTKVANSATNPNAMNGLKFDEIPVQGALVSLYAAAVTVTDTIGFSVGTEDFLNAANPNIEVSADVVDIDRDQILFREPVGPGKIFVVIVATTAVGWLLVLEYLPG